MRRGTAADIETRGLTADADTDESSGRSPGLVFAGLSSHCVLPPLHQDPLRGWAVIVDAIVAIIALTAAGNSSA